MTPPLRTSLLYDDPGALIAAIPGLLGFHPDDSLVLITYTGARQLDLESVLRVDLPPADHVTDVAHQLCMVAMNHEAVVVDMIVLGGPGADPPDQLPHRELVTELADLFEANRISLAHAVWAGRAATGRSWWCYHDRECTGHIHNPATSPLAAAMTAPGTITRRDRNELAALLTPDPDHLLAPRTALIEALPADPNLETEYAFVRTTIDTLPDPDPEPDPDPDVQPDPEPRQDPESRCVCGAAPQRDSRFRHGRPEPAQESESTVRDGAESQLGQESPFGPEPDLDNPTIARLARALSIPDIREACLAYPLTSRAARAERLWAALTRVTPGPLRANPACLLAVSTYLRGEGTLASIALDLAEAANPTHHLTHTLREVIDLGLPPRRFRLMLAESVISSLTDTPPDPEPPTTPAPNTPAATSHPLAPTHAHNKAPSPESPDPLPGSRHLTLAHTNPKHAAGPESGFSQWEAALARRHTGPEYQARHRAA